VRRRAAKHQIDRQVDQLRADRALNNAIGRGIGYGFAAVAAEAAPQLAAVRLAAGLRWTGALRSAVVLERITWAGAEGELIGARAAWQGYRATPWQGAAKTVSTRVALDYSAQLGANLITGDDDPFLNINGLETAMAAYGIRPIGIGIGSAAVNINLRGHIKVIGSPDYEHRVHFNSFLAQATAGTLLGYTGLKIESSILEKGSKNIAMATYLYAALRQPQLAYPLGIGMYHLSAHGVPALLGTVEETIEGTADGLLTPPNRMPPDSLARP